MARKLKETTYTSSQPAQSKIVKNTFVNRLNSLFGFATLRPNQRRDAKTSIEKDYGLKFVKVDLDNQAYRISNAALGRVYDSEMFSSHLEKLFTSYLNETQCSYDDIIDRQKRIDELSYLYYNDVMCSRVVHLCADEATQIDMQDRIISVESPNANFTNRTYELLSQWGADIQQRVWQACFDIELYGEAFWAHKITQRGVDHIKPIKVQEVVERLEFDPIRMADYLSHLNGNDFLQKGRSEKLKKLMDILSSDKSIEEAESLADMFDTKLLGYELKDGIVVPPWLITHFRFNADNSSFAPYGMPPLLNCLAPFHQLYTTMALQGLARSMAFPLMLYKVKTTPGLRPGQAMELVDEVRSEYENIGVTPMSVGNEVYTINSKMWIADGLLDVQVIDSKIDFDFVGDIELYQDRVAIAAGVPKAYLDQEYGGFGNSAISLVEQYKPFARHVFSIQSTFLQGLGELIRLHYAITGEFDYNTPFILSMRFPAEEMSSDKEERRTASIELSTSIVDLIHSVLGIPEEDPLPQDIILDILNKYSFLDPTDTEKWLRLSKINAINSSTDEGGEGGDDDFSFDDSGMDDGGGLGVDGGDDMGEVAESNKAAIAKRKRLLMERKRYLNKLQEQKFKEIRKSWKECKEGIFVKFCEKHHLKEWQSNGHTRHSLFVPKLDPLFNESIELLKTSGDNRHLKENTLEEVYNNSNGKENIDPINTKIKESLEKLEPTFEDIENE